MIEGLPELENGKGARWVSRPAVTEFIRALRPGVKEFDLFSLEEFADREYDSFNAGRDTPEHCAECAANYPDVMRVIPDAAEGKKGRPTFFRWEYLKLIDDIEKAIGIKWPDGAVYQLPERKSSPMKVVIEQFEGLKVTVVIMPYKVCCVNAEV
nr:MAG TPA: hypothetical protein [Caudoviricetes sp.]